ncbi:MAG TPA: MBL fold metallo-hydrolase [Cytophagales bacterium]|jgi:hydroxyacylglutathione hydrolase|nr:MBL fold metallo-hydrolase [Cytophagales bacterium]
MKIEQIYTGCLAEAAYYIESKGEAAIIDPLRETSPYLERARKDNAKIKYVFETHFHADFVSGHIDLSRESGATIVFGPTATPNYDAHIANDNELFQLGDVQIKVLHTPGHTLESTSYLLIDEHGKEQAVFTGDTLFVGDVGRPDLVQKVKKEITPEFLAGLLFDSLRNKIMTLPDGVIVFPGHGAGSACGKKMDKETESTIGKQKKFNYALRADMTREEFIQEVTDGLVEPPNYFPANVILNVTGSSERIDKILEKGTTPLAIPEFETLWESLGALVLDTRKKEDFVNGFIPGSVFIGIDDSFAPWVGTLIPDLKQPLLLIVEHGRELEVVTRLARVGYDNAIGFLKGGFEAWKNSGKDVETIEEISAEELANQFLKNPKLHVLDARRVSEFKTEHLEKAENFPLDFINKNMAQLNRDEKYFIHCAGGYRSVIMATILKSRGFNHIVNIRGGYKALSATPLKRTMHQEINTEL